MPAVKANAYDSHASAMLDTIMRDHRVTSQEMSNRLAEAEIEISYQSVHKYRKGHARISFGMACELARALGIDVADLAEDSARGQNVARVERTRQISLEMRDHIDRQVQLAHRLAREIR